jgi:hypothetical protein
MDDATLLSMAKRAHRKASATVLAITPESRELSKKKSQYYGEVFACREPHTSARDRVTRDSIVMAELRTNVIVSLPFHPIPTPLLISTCSSKTNTLSLPISLPTSPSATNDPNPPS